MAETRLLYGAALAGSADRHRNEGAHDAILDVFVARQQQIAKTAREHGEDDVVHRAAEGAAHRLHVGERGPRPVPPPVRTDGAVDRRHRGRAHDSGPRAQSARDLAELRQAPDAAHASVARAGAELLVRARRERAERIDDEPRVGRLALGVPLVGPGRRRFGLGVEHDREEIGPRHAVDHAVVHFRHERPVAAVETVDHPHLPQRLVPVELLRHHSADEIAELTIAPGRRERAVPEVVAEVEVRIVDPQRPAELQRHEPHLLAVRAAPRAACPRPSPRNPRTGARARRRSPPSRCACG